MTIQRVCDTLRAQLFGQGFEYGFVLDGRTYKPSRDAGFDREFDRQLRMNYRIQQPAVTLRYKTGTCMDAVLVMKSTLEALSIPCKIWLQYDRGKNKPHTIVTFTAQTKTVYLELTPQSSKPWYGRECLYPDEAAFLEEFARNGYEMYDVTGKVFAGQRPSVLLSVVNG